MLSKLFFITIFACGTIVAPQEKDSPSTNQIVRFKQHNQHPVGILSSPAGRPINYLEASGTLNKRLLFNEFFLDSIAHFNQERIPERVVHAVGSGAFGYFEVTHDITDVCKAKLFNQIGKRTPVAVRFSPTAVERGGSEALRGPRGYAVKFYTEEGNWDFVGFSFPVFEIKDPLLFPAFTHAIKKNPATNLPDFTTFWDFFTLHPETFHMLMFTLADRGIPDGYRHMAGYSVHTLQIVNEAGKSSFARIYIEPDAGLNHLTTEESKQKRADDPDYFKRDLYDAIANGNYPSWTCFIQVLTWDQVQNSKYDIFDVTRTIPEEEYPKRPFGKIVLNRNPVNHFAEIEQLAFCPTNLVPGILGAPDKMFEARRLVYKDAQRYRLGVNTMNAGVNSPRFRTYTYNRDGHAPVNNNEDDIPNYYPNSFNGPVPFNETNAAELVEIYQTPPYNLDQSQELYASYKPDEQKRLLENIFITLKLVPEFIQERAINIFALIDAKLGADVREGLITNSTN